MSRLSALSKPVSAKFAGGGTHNVVFLGGSVMNGSNAAVGFGFRAQLEAWLPFQFPDCTFTFHNIANGGTRAWWRMFRIHTEVLPLSPTPSVIFTDAVNESTTAVLFPNTWEAMIRRLRTAFPNTPLIAVNSPTYAAIDGSDNTFVTDRFAAQQSVARILRHYDVPLVNWAATSNLRLIKEVDGWTPPSAFMDDVIHPNTAGHTSMFHAVKGYFSTRADPSATNRWNAIGTYPILGDTTAVTQLTDNTPQLFDGSTLTLGAGWTADGTAAVCSTTDAVASFTHPSSGNARSFGVQSDGNFAEIEYRIDGGSWLPAVLSSTHRITADFGDNISPTVEIRRKVGTVRIEKLLWL